MEETAFRKCHVFERRLYLNRNLMFWLFESVFAFHGGLRTTVFVKSRREMIWGVLRVKAAVTPGLAIRRGHLQV
jgi:hypothetical protein